MTLPFETLQLRANPAYRAVAWNRLPAEVRDEMAPGADSFGVLLPVDGQTLAPVAIDCDTALLFLSLQEPGPAPDFACVDGDGKILRRLIFDSILQLEHGGSFIGGADACARLGVEHHDRANDLVNLSIEALSYAAALSHADAATLMQKLYVYNRRPATPALRRLLPDRASSLAFLGLAPGGSARDGIDRSWSSEDDGSAWLVFHRRQPQPRATQPCKLYVGLAFEDLARCLPAIAATFARARASQFKIGTDLDGLLRPDKFVAYFPNKDALFAAARDLASIVADCAVHAVPFTAAMTAEGRLSWGMDPTDNWLGNRQSWRQWICEQLAAALVAARQSADAIIPPWQFALERLGLDGIDTDNFMPTGQWSGASR